MASATQWLRNNAPVTALWDFMEDQGFQLAAALAFYSALSFAPILILFIWITTLLGGNVQHWLVDQMQTFVGSQAANVTRTVIQNARARPSIGQFAGLVSIGVVLFSATTVFAQLRASMNQVWNVHVAPRNEILSYLITRLFGLLMLLVLGIVFTVAVIVTGILSSIVGSPSGGPHYFWQVVNIAVSLAIFTVLFAALFKILPDAHVQGLVVWGGALLTAGLFELGKYFIGVYLHHSRFASSYGAAGTMVVMLIWVYYSWMIVLYGAELTQVWAKRSGRAIVADSRSGRRKDKSEAAIGTDRCVSDA